MKTTALLSAVGGLCLALATPARAALFTTDTSIGPNDTNYDGQDIVVVGCTLTIDGIHDYSDLVIIENGTVTHSPITNASGGGLNLTVSNLFIELGSAIKADGLGFGPGLGAGAGTSLAGDPEFGIHDGFTNGGGGGFGGCGGSSFAGAAGGGSYGSIIYSTNAGSGGGAGFGEGGAGGGLVNLTIADALTVDGQINANGADGINLASGGGSGGGISISASSISGTGSITANGGSGETIDGGGGGGGRIAIFFSTNDFTGTIRAAGGQGAVAGGAGTINLQSEVGSGDQLLVDNAGLSGTNTPLDVPNLCSLTISGGAIAYVSNSAGLTLSNFFIGSNSWLVSAPVPALLSISVESNVVIQPGGGIQMDAVATLPNGSSGGTNQVNGDTFGGGGGGGGNGGAGFGAAGGAANSASAAGPTDLGSTGGPGTGKSPYNAGGAGGGALELHVAGTLTLNGSISADGGQGIGDGSGGGSGGSVYLTLGALAGTGAISANGGAAGSDKGGGGAGGRIAVWVETNLLTGSLSAVGGQGMVNGGAGTILLIDERSVAQLVVDNGGLPGANTPAPNLDLAYEMDLTVTNGASLGASGILLSGGARIRNVVVAAGSALIVPPFGTSASPEESGGSYGGYGGIGAAGVSSQDENLGNLEEPTSEGEHGGIGPMGVAGGYGGGETELSASGTFLLNGTLSANGQSAPVGSGAGGGSGGSVYLSSIGMFTGSGSISANGGMGDLPNGGGGGGGRIAIYATSNSFTGSLSAYGAPGYESGGAGTIWVTKNAESIGRLIVDNGGLIGTNTPFSSLPDCDLTVANGAVAAFSEQDFSIRNLFVGSNSLIVPAGTQFPFTMEITVTSNATILPTGGIIVDGKGGPPGDGYNAGSSSETNGITTGGGGGFAGDGGRSALGASGASVSSSDWIDSTPVGAAGGGGAGMGVDGRNVGGTGGGNLGLTVSGALILDGTLSANGTTGPGAGSGGGAGGGIWISTGPFSGTGAISANGGAGQSQGGGGGGGVIRLTMSSTNNQFTGIFSAHGGVGAMAGGAGVIYQNPFDRGVAQVLLDNGGLSGADTPFSGVPAGTTDLTITNGAIAALIQFEGSYIRNLVIGSNSFIVDNVINDEDNFPPVSFILGGNATILPTGGIILDGRGAANNEGEAPGRVEVAAGGGGGYGGNGGASSAGAPGGVAYGSVNSPEQEGSGGGNATEPFNTGGVGGGVFGLTTRGTLSLGGSISVNGSAGVTKGCGGGSGGSVFLTVGAFTGTGSISANGGAGQSQGGGGGGGGRIAVITPTNLFTGQMSAHGGVGFANGGAGTVYLASGPQAETAQLIFDNGGFPGALTAVPLEPLLSGATLDIQNGAAVDFSSSTTIRSLLVGSNSLLAQTNPAQLYLVVTSNVTVQAGGRIILDGSGYGSRGPGAGSNSLSSLGILTGGGGGHGGYGGNGQSGASGGNVYDKQSGPILLGSGGGAGAGSQTASAPGGGALELSVTGTLEMDGLISANGAAPTNEAGGGGSGGSIELNAGILSGTGSILANGASGDLPDGGGGGGGRIELNFTSNRFTGVLQAHGGPGFVAGGAGTIQVGSGMYKTADLIIDNGGLNGTNTPISAPSILPSFVEAPNLIITGAASVVPQIPEYAMALASLLIESNAVLTHPSGQGSVDVWVAGDVVVESNASICVDGQGYNATNRGPGGGMLGSGDIGSGGGHGGMGGDGSTGATGGGTNDSVTEPVEWGSAGGVFLTGDPDLSQGGGAIMMRVVGTMTINGTVSANGNAAIFPGAGGGAGGSIYLTVGVLSGNGVLSANGGAGHTTLGGGGGGGRIALVFGTNLFSGATNVVGGVGFAAGQDGTLWLSTDPDGQGENSKPVPVGVGMDPQSGNLILQWNGIAGQATCQAESSIDLINWQPVGNPVPISNGMNTLVLPLGKDPGTFYRLITTY
jgi:hypothetical protein